MIRSLKLVRRWFPLSLVAHVNEQNRHDETAESVDQQLAFSEYIVDIRRPSRRIAWDSAPSPIAAEVRRPPRRIAWDSTPSSSAAEVRRPPRRIVSASSSTAAEVRPPRRSGFVTSDAIA